MVKNYPEAGKYVFPFTFSVVRDRGQFVFGIQWMASDNRYLLGIRIPFVSINVIYLGAENRARVRFFEAMSPEEYTEWLEDQQYE